MSGTDRAAHAPCQPYSWLISNVRQKMSSPETFSAKHHDSDVLYASEIVAALREGSARVTHSPAELASVSASELLHTYERRAKHLSRFTISHAEQLRRDAEALCAGLREKKDDRCIAWGFERSPHFIYWFWEWASDKSFVGAIKAVDDREISEAERQTLWGEKKSA